MSTEQEQTEGQAPSTAVARAKPQLPLEVQREVEERKLRNAVASQIAGLSWGKDLDMVSRRALADYCRERGIDAATEIHILGGRLYKNGEFYLNRAQPLVRAGILDLQYEYVNADPRIATLAQSDNPETARKAREMIDYRTLRRIEFNIPEAAQSAVVATVILLQHGTKLEAAKWCGGGTRKRDPVGDENPEATSITRAFRKALKMAVGYEKQVASAFGELNSEDGELANVEGVIADRKEQARLMEQETDAWKQAHKPHPPIQTTIVQPRSENAALMSPDRIAAIAATPDPYGNSVEPRGVPAIEETPDPLVNSVEPRGEKVAALERMAKTAMPLPAVTPSASEFDDDDPTFGDMFNDDPPERQDAIREGH